MDSVDVSYDVSRRLSLRHMEALSEDTQELLSPHDGDGDGSFVFEPIMVSDDDTTDDEKPGRGNGKEEGILVANNEYGSTNKSLMDSDDVNYVSDDSSEMLPEQAPSSVSLIRSHTPPNALLPTHSRKRSDGQQVMHIFHDELATLYEEPNKSSESLDSIKSASSIAESNTIVRLRDTLDESNIRARWEYALQLMVGQCEPSGLLYNSIAEMMPSTSYLTYGENTDMDVAEI